MRDLLRVGAPEGRDAGARSMQRLRFLLEAVEAGTSRLEGTPWSRRCDVSDG
jgi:hypothetical protein